MGTQNKKILIVGTNLATGGVQRSLINLLNEIKDIYDVTLFVFSNDGEYKDSVPSQVKVIEASPLLKLLGISQVQSKRMGKTYYFFRAILAIYAKIFSNYLPIRLLILTQKRLTGFDAAISFVHSAYEKILYGGCNEFVIHRVQAQKKISFLHCDFSNYGGNTRENRNLYRSFDTIAAVSEGCRKSFLQAVPEFSGKTQCVYNCHNYLDIQTKANQNPVNYTKDTLNVITVARLSEEKGIFRGMNVINRLVKEGYDLHWHIIGDGPQKKDVQERIIQENASEYIILHGNQENPYRYMKNVDILLLPSYHEAAPMVFSEAKALCIPIMTTCTTSAEEMVIEGKEGFICQNTEDAIYFTFKRILDHPETLQKCGNFMEMQSYSDENALSQFCSLIEGRN